MADPLKTRRNLLRKLDAEWTAFTSAYAGLSDEQLTRPGVVGEWAVKDLIAHVAIWEAEALKHLPLISRGSRPPLYSVAYGGIDAFNDQMIATSRDRTLSAVVTQSAETHRQLIAYLEGVPPELLAGTSRFRRRLRLDTYAHYPIHTEQITAWRAGQRETGTG